MSSIRPCLGALLLLASPLAAQLAKQEQAAPPAIRPAEDEEKTFPLQFGVAGGALSY